MQEIIVWNSLRPIQTRAPVPFSLKSDQKMSQSARNYISHEREFFNGQTKFRDSLYKFITKWKLIKFISWPTWSWQRSSRLYHRFIKEVSSSIKQKLCIRFLIVCIWFYIDGSIYREYLDSHNFKTMFSRNNFDLLLITMTQIENGRDDGWFALFDWVSLQKYSR